VSGLDAAAQAAVVPELRDLIDFLDVTAVNLAFSDMQADLGGANVADLAWEYEKRVPVIAESHIRLRESIEKSVSFARVHGQVGVQYVDEKVTDAREAVEGWVKQGK
jgi:hypothetical protein